MTVLLSIKPKWAEAILNGEKKWEYRLKPPAIDPPYEMLLYATSPKQEIVGEVKVNHRIYTKLDDVIERTIDETPHSPDEIRDYFQDNKRATALQIDDIKRYDEPIKLDECMTPPTNFMYVDKEDIV